MHGRGRSSTGHRLLTALGRRRIEIDAAEDRAGDLDELRWGEDLLGGLGIVRRRQPTARGGRGERTPPEIGELGKIEIAIERSARRGGGTPLAASGRRAGEGALGFAEPEEEPLPARLADPDAPLPESASAIVGDFLAFTAYRAADRSSSLADRAAVASFRVTSPDRTASARAGSSRATRSARRTPARDTFILLTAALTVIVGLTVADQSVAASDALATAAGSAGARGADGSNGFRAAGPAGFEPPPRDEPPERPVAASSLGRLTI